MIIASEMPLVLSLIISFILIDWEYRLIPKSEIIEINEFIGILDINGKEIYNNSETVNGLVVKYNHLHACYGLYNANGYLNDIQCEMYNEDGTFIDIWKTNCELK